MHSRRQVLLVENDERGADLLWDRLRKGGCELHLAKSAGRAKELLRRQRFDLVLSELLLSDGTAFQLIPLLLSNRTTVLFSNVLEDGCWWMTALLQGQDHTKDPGPLPAEFKLWLDKFLSEDSSLSGSIPTAIPAIHRPDKLLESPDRIAWKSSIIVSRPRLERTSLPLLSNPTNRKGEVT
jgi:CheY-like chemotaxis protein